MLLQGYPREWEPDSEWHQLGAVSVRLRRFTLDGSLLSGEMEYVLDGRHLLHAFEAQLITEDELDRDLEAAGLRRRRYLDERGAWIEAVPASP